MKAKSSAHYQREYRRRLRDLGLVKKEVWILPENAEQLTKLEKQLRQTPTLAASTATLLEQGDSAMTKALTRWNTENLYNALIEHEPFASKAAGIELIDGVEPALHITMHDYGDLPLFLTVAGEQIVVEAVLWRADEVADSALFNDAILRTHKYLPLSTISLDKQQDGTDYYQMFGALSASSVLPNIVLEIEMLAANVIHATEAYSNFLIRPIESQG